MESVKQIAVGMELALGASITATNHIKVARILSDIWPRDAIVGRIEKSTLHANRFSGLLVTWSLV